LEEDQGKYLQKTFNEMRDKEIMQSPADPKRADAETDTPTTKGGRSSRKRDTKVATPVTPEAGYSGGVGKKGRRSRG
jgi:hypothetical protein